MCVLIFQFYYQYTKFATVVFTQLNIYFGVPMDPQVVSYGMYKRTRWGGYYGTNDV